VFFGVLEQGWVGGILVHFFAFFCVWPMFSGGGMVGSGGRDSPLVSVECVARGSGWWIGGIPGFDGRDLGLGAGI
jgi:hypothetical protein